MTGSFGTPGLKGTRGAKGLKGDLGETGLQVGWFFDDYISAECIYLHQISRDYRDELEILVTQVLKDLR